MTTRSFSRLEISGYHVDQMQARGDVEALAESLRRKIQELDRAEAIVQAALTRLSLADKSATALVDATKLLRSM